MRKLILIPIILILPLLSLAQTIDVTVQGISDGYKNSKQQDRDEAILDAKLKAIERAGVSIEAVTTMENFKLKKDWVESKATAIIQPGFQIIDVGYGSDGLYHVVLSGKVTQGGGPLGDSEGDKKFRMAKLYLESEHNKAMQMFHEVANNYSDCSAADDAIYYLITESTYNYNSANDLLIKLKAYYPKSPYIKQAENYIAGKEEEKRRIAEEKRLEEIKRAKSAIESMTFTAIPSGSFQMGSNDGGSDEKPVHNVYVKSFKMMTTEVTQAQWQALMGSNPSNWKGDNLPVENVSWDDIQDFLRELNRIDPGKKYRLPTEAEWEYACRAGTTTKYYTGDKDSDLNRAGWYNGNSGSNTHPVGQKAPNAWGLYDMHGNVWEWCEDWFHSSYNGAPKDGSAWNSPSGQYRVLRGGSWLHPPRSCRSAHRHRYNPDLRYIHNGFRLCVSP